MSKVVLLIAMVIVALLTMKSLLPEKSADDEHMLSGHQKQMQKAQDLESVMDQSAIDRLERADSVE